MRPSLLVALLLLFSSTTFAQTSDSNSTTIVAVPDPNDKLPTIGFLTPTQVLVFNEEHGIGIVRVVDKPNTYRWSDGAETITFAQTLENITVCKYNDANGELVGYMIGASDESGTLPSKTKTGLFRRIAE